jgi:hypothetical protein
MNSDTLRAERRYIHDNPRRYCLPKAHPDLFVKASALRNSRLPQGLPWMGFGNLFLIDKPELMPVRCRIAEHTAAGIVMVSPFISPGEKKITALVMAQPYGSLILLKPDGFAPLYKPSGTYFDLCAEGRLLILSAFPHTGRRRALSRECCIQLNDWGQHICKPLPAL